MLPVAAVVTIGVLVYTDVGPIVHVVTIAVLVSIHTGVDDKVGDPCSQCCQLLL